MVKLSTIKKRRLSKFVICILLAALAWFFIALSSTIVYKRKTVLEYRNLPINKAFYPLQSDSVTLQLEAKGWRSLISLFTENTKPLPLNLGLLNKENYIIFSKQLGSFSKNYIKGQTIVAVKPDTIYFDFAKRATKKIPVKLVQDIQFKKQYGLSSKVQINPGYVTLVGPEKEIKKINFWETEVIKAKRVYTSFSRNINLAKADKTNFNIYPRVVNVKIPVEEFTEKEIALPVVVKNNLRFLKVNCIPEKVYVTLYVPLSKYARVNTETVEASVDLNLWTDYRATKLPVKISNNVPNVVVLKVYPNLIDFIIKK